MPIDVSKIKPKSSDNFINRVLDNVFKEDSTQNEESRKVEKSVAGSPSESTGKMLYQGINRDIVVDVGDTVDADGYTNVKDEQNRIYHVKAKELKPLPNDYFEVKEQKNERAPGFWNTYLGDMLERIGAGLYDFNGDLYNLADKTDKILTKIDPVGNFIADYVKKKWEKKHPGEEYKSWFRHMAESDYDYANVLRQRSDRYAGKDFKQLWKEGDYAGMCGEAFLTASESLTQSTVAMAGGGWGLALTGATTAAKKYDQLDEMPETKDMPEAMKVYNAVSTGIFEAMFEKLGDAVVGRGLKTIYKLKGKQEAEKIIQSELENWMDAQFKKYGLLWMPAAEGIEEVATQISQNITDYCTGVTDVWQPMDGTMESFVYGAAGGAQFSGVGALGLIRNKVMQKRTEHSLQQAQKNLYNQFPGEDTETFSKGLTFMSPAEQETIIGTMARDGNYSKEQIEAVVNFANHANQFKKWNNPSIEEAEKNERKELFIQTALKQFDQAVSPLANETGYIQKVVLTGNETPAYIVKGEVVVNENEQGQLIVDTENSSKELFYQDETGSMQVISPQQIDKIESYVYFPQIREQYEKQLRGEDLLTRETKEETDVSIQDIVNGDVIVYVDEKGNEAKGVVNDAFSNAEYVFIDDGSAVAREKILRKELVTSEESSISEEEKRDLLESQIKTEEKQIFEIEPGVKATKQADGSYLLDRSYTKSELSSAEKVIKRLNKDYEDDGICFELTELPKVEPENPLEKKHFGIIGRLIDKEMDVQPILPEELIKEAPEQPIKEVTEETPSTKKLKGVNKKGRQQKGLTSEEIFGAKNSVITRERYEELKRQWKEKTQGQLNAGFDPELLSIGTQIAMFHIEAGARKFADFAQSVVADIGENIRPYLKSIYEGAKYMPGMENVAKDMDNSDFVANFKIETVGNKSVANEKVKELYIKHKKELQELKARKEEFGKLGSGFVLKEEIAEKENMIRRMENNFGESIKAVHVEETPKLEGTKGKIEGNNWIISKVVYPTQSYSTENIEMDYPSEQVNKWVKKDAVVFVRALGEVLGWEYERMGKSKNDILSVNIAPAGGDVNFILWKPGTEAGVYVQIDYKCDYYQDKYDNYRPKAKFLWRVTTKGDKWKGLRNNYYSLNATTGELAELFNKAVDDYLEEKELTNIEDERNTDRGLSNHRGKNSIVGNVGNHASGNLSDVQGRPIEELSESNRGPGNGSERSGDGNWQESNRSSGNNEQDRVIEEEARNSKNEIPNRETNKGNRGVSTNSSSINRRNFVIQSSEFPVHGKISKIKANIKAIKLLKQLENKSRPATVSEQNILSQYSGWGGLSEVLNKEKAQNPDWQYKTYHDEVVDLLTEDEFTSAINSTLNAHYTPFHVIESLWELAERLGFSGGKVLEPAAGTGNFLGLMPLNLAEKSSLHAYELDSITGRILKYLYPDANVKNKGYETSNERGFDLVITNVPFAQTAPFDAVNKDISKFNLHNYFIAKSLKQLQPGGLGIYITSYTTLDSGSGVGFREWVINEGNADFIGAIRLPNNAFDNAGTEITTDIVVFRKRDSNQASTYAQGFRYVYPFKETKLENGQPSTIDVNEYYCNHPEMMLGEPMLAFQAGRGTIYRGDIFTLSPYSGKDLKVLLKEAIRKFPENILKKDGSVKVAEAAHENDKEGSLIIRNGELKEVCNGELLPPSWLNEYIIDRKGHRASKKDVAERYIEIREAINSLVDAELADRPDIEENRNKLNKLYEDFTSRFGPFYNNLKVRFLCDSDVGWGSVFALEKIEAKYQDEDGKVKRTYVIEKADIFFKRVSFPIAEPTQAASLSDAVNISIAYRNNVDLSYISNLLSLPEEEVKNELLEQELVFENPSTQLLEDSDSYLSGFVRQKLVEAEDAAQSNPAYERNVTALKKVIPPDIPASQVSFKLGAPFIPCQYVEQFVKDKLDVIAKIQYVPELNRYIIKSKKNTDNPKNLKTYATQRTTGIWLVEKGLNITQPIVYDVVKEDDKFIRVQNTEETAAAQQKLIEIQNEFVDYIYENEPFIKDIVRIYNEQFNGYIEKQYSDPPFIHFPGSNTAITLRLHQRKAVLRILRQSTLLAHQVGTGKTFTMITAAMEMRRLKVAKKPLIVVQNSTVEQFVASFKFLYPSAKILAPTKSQMDAKNRIRLLNLITYGEWDAVIVPQSFVPMIPDSEERQKAYLKEQIEQIEVALLEVDKEEEKVLYSQLTSRLENFNDMLLSFNKKSRTVKKKAQKNLSVARRLSRQMERQTDNIRTFEQLGIDALFVDEAHAYKKLGLITKLSNVKGIDQSGSKRAFSMFMKVRYIQSLTGGRNVVFATGTPITNTMAELWTMIRFISPEILKKYHIEHFDEFASTFGAIEPSLEFTPSGSFKIVERFKKFINVPELITAFRAVADVVLTEDIPEFKNSNTIPKLKNGSFTQIIIEQSEGLKTLMKELKQKLISWEKLPKMKKLKLRHIPLVIFNQAKKAAIDLRLLDPRFVDDPQSKTNRIVKEAFRIYQETNSYKGTQLIFSDMYQSPEGVTNFRFNLYEDIKRKLIALGVPENEIAIIHDYKDSQRELLFNQMNTGEKRFLFASTEKGGVGTNVQERLAAAHHADATATPKDFEQRNGRILRQGNIHAEMKLPVEILCYGVIKTLDATGFQRLAIKQNFINQMMKGKGLARVCEDYASEDDPGDQSFEQLMATLSGSQYAILHQQRLYEYRQLEMAKKAFERRQIEINSELNDALTKAKFYQTQENELNKQRDIILKYFPTGKITSVKINNKVYTEKLSEEIDKAFLNMEFESSRVLKKIPLSLYLNDHPNPVTISLTDLLSHTKNYEFYLTDNEGSKIESTINTGQGFITSITKRIGNVKDELRYLKERRDKNEANIPFLREELRKRFDKEDKLNALQDEITQLEEKMKQEVIDETQTENSSLEQEEPEDTDEGQFSLLPEKEAEVPEVEEPEETKLISEDFLNNKWEDLASLVDKRQHTETGEDIFIVHLQSRIEYEEFKKVKKVAKESEGYFSKFVNGFVFKKESDAEAFRKAINGTTAEEEIRFRKVSSDLNKHGSVIGEIRRLEHLLGVKVKCVNSREQLSEEITNRMDENKHYPGVFIVESGEVYLVLNEIEDVADAQATVLHEVIGHKGIQGIFGNKIERFAEEVLKSLPVPVRSEWVTRYKGNRQLAAEEYVAGFAEGYREPSLFIRINGLIRGFFRRAGIRLKLSNKDLMYLLWRGVNRLKVTDSAIEIAEKLRKDEVLYREAEVSYDNVNMEEACELEIDEQDKVKLHNEFVSRRFKFVEAYQDRMLAVKKLQELIETEIGQRLPDYMDSYMFENTLASRNTFETEYFRNNFLKPLIQVISDLERHGLSRRNIENYVMVKHGLERNIYISKRIAERWYAKEIQKLEKECKDNETLFQVQLSELNEGKEKLLEKLARQDFSGISSIVTELPDKNIEKFIEDVESRYEVNALWECIQNATGFGLRKWFECGMIDEKRYKHIKGMFKYYVPLRGFDEKIARDVYEYFTDINGVFNSPLRHTRGRTSRAESPFAHIVSMAESAIVGGNKNLLKLHFYRLAQKYPSGLMSVSKVWYEENGLDEEMNPVYKAVFPEYDSDGEIFRQNIEVFNKRMAELEAEGKAFQQINRLNVGYRLLDSEPEEHIVRLHVNGEEYAVMVHGDPRISQAINGLNDQERTDNRVVQAIRAMNRQMAANFTTRNPAFVISNLTRDLIFSISTLSVKEGSKYRNRFIRNIYKASRAIQRYISGKPDYNKVEDVMFKEFISHGGETGYTALHNIEKFKKMIDREIKNVHQSRMIKTSKRIIEFFEKGNRWAEDLSRFSTYMTSRQSGRSVLQSVSDAKEVTINFNRKGSGAYGAQMFRSMYLFFNAAVQSLANLYGISVNYPRRTGVLLASYAAIGAIVPLLLMAFGGDDALKEYLNLPDYVRKNNLCIYLPKDKGFITIPLPIELRVFFSWGDSAFRYMACDVSGESACGEVIMGMIDLLPLNPVGGNTPFIPDALKPIAQSYMFNQDFTGRPIAKVNDYNKYMPEYQRVYKGSSEFFVKSSEVLNTLSGGDYATQGGIDRAGQVLTNLFSAEVNITNPAALEHLFEAYLGGTFITINQTLKTLEDLGTFAITGKNHTEARNLPVVNRFYNTGSVFSSQAKINQKYYEALDELKETESRIRRYKDAIVTGRMDIEKVTRAYENMFEKKLIDRAEIIKYYFKEISKINEALHTNGLTEDERDELESEVLLLKIQMLEELKKVYK